MAVLHITSAANERVRTLKSLQTAKGRQETGLFWAEGRKLTQEALRDAQVRTLVVAVSQMQEAEKLIGKAQDTIILPDALFDSMCETKTPQGMAAAVEIPQALNLQLVHGPLLVLDGVQDPGNVGTMLRTAEASGFWGVLLSEKSADVFSGKTVRATMGSVYRMPIYRGKLPQALKSLQKQGYAIVSTQLEGEDFKTLRPSIPACFALVIGSEGNGVTEEVRDMANFRVRLSMHGQVESLNAAVAAGILMYAMLNM